MLDCAQTGDLQLLRWLRSPAVGGVVGLDDQKSSTRSHDRAGHIVVGDLETDHVAKSDSTDIEEARSVARLEIARDSVESSDQSGQLGAKRHVLTERDEMTFCVLTDVPVDRVPDDPDIEHVLWVARNLDDRTDKDRAIDRPRGSSDQVGSSRVLIRVEVTCILRPDDQLRLWLLAGRDISRQTHGLAHMVAKYLFWPTKEIQPRFSNVSLNQRDDGAWVTADGLAVDRKGN
jgi:hypothetical protein